MPLPDRLLYSFAALIIVWLGGALTSTLYVKDARVFIAVLIWGGPFFAIGWLAVGLPLVSLNKRLLGIPATILGLFGGAAGFLIVLLPSWILWALSPGRQQFVYDWAYLTGWPAYGAAIGATGTVIYLWLFSRAIRREG